MKLRKRYLPVAAVLGAAVAIVPALAAGPSEAKLEVNENCVEPDWQCWTIPGPDPKPASITITVGEVVTFADKTSFAANITWTGATAPMCSGAVPVSPAVAATGWEGTCKFEQPGTYELEDSHMFYPEATSQGSRSRQHRHYVHHDDHNHDTDDHNDDAHHHNNHPYDDYTDHNHTDDYNADGHDLHPALRRRGLRRRHLLHGHDARLDGNASPAGREPPPRNARAGESPAW